ELAEQELGDVDLPGRYRAQDIGMLDERAVGVHRDVERAAGVFLHVLRERLDVAGVELAVGVRRRHVPFGLRVRGEGGQRRGCNENSFHWMDLPDLTGNLSLLPPAPWRPARATR